MSPIVAECPECAGPWLNGWRWQHTPGACSLLPDLDATQAADHQRLAASGREFLRPTTEAEAALWRAAPPAPAAYTGATLVMPIIGGVVATAISGYPYPAPIDTYPGGPDHEH